MVAVAEGAVVAVDAIVGGMGGVLISLAEGAPQRGSIES